VPMALAGVPPLVFGIVALVDLLYQFWVHTEHVPKLGWFDRWFCSPSNHRVHHAVNDRYLDRNYGGILIIWDRLFGSFEEEHDDEPCIYGTRAPLRSFNPVWANLEVYAALARDAWHARSWADKVRVWLKPPGWRPADVAQRFPKPAFRLEAVRRVTGDRFDETSVNWNAYRAKIGDDLVRTMRPDILVWERYYQRLAWLVTVGERVEPRKAPIFRNDEPTAVTIRLIEELRPDYVLVSPTWHQRLSHLVDSEPRRFVPVAADSSFQLYRVVPASAGRDSRL